MRAESRGGGGVSVTRRAPSGSAPPTPRAAIGSASEPVIAITSSAAPTRLPRRPKE